MTNTAPSCLSEGRATEALAHWHRAVLDVLRKSGETGAVARMVPPGPQRLIAAALSSDADMLEEVIATSDSGCHYLADWVGFWAFGPDWRPAFAAVQPSEADWLGDWSWMQLRRRTAPFEERDPAADIPVLSGPGPVRVEFEVNGIPGIACLDSGAPSSLLSEDFAHRAGVQANPADYGRAAHDGAGNARSICPGTMARICLGGWTGRHLPVEIVDLAFGVDAILAPFDLFGRSPVTFDIARGRVRVGAPVPARAIRLPVFWSSGVASVRAEIAGLQVFALLDTGAGGTLLTRDADHPAPLSPTRSFRSATALGEVEVDTAGNTDIVLPGLPIFRDRLYLKPAPVVLTSPLPRLAEGSLGRPWFAAHVVHFPAVRGQVLLHPSQDEEDDHDPVW